LRAGVRPVDRDRAAAIQRTAIADWIRVIAQASPGAALFERDGVVASAVPAAPQRSIVNSVSYADARTLAEVYDELAGFFATAGIGAWTVWTPDFDAHAIATLQQNGHAFDGKPAAMVLDLGAYETRDPGDLDWDAQADPQTHGEINDRAYGHAPGEGYAGALAQPVAGHRLYQARVNGQPACVAATMDHEGGDLGVYFVATDPAFQGRGLGTRLMALVLNDAQERGLHTASLQASGAGEPVYTALGFERWFRLHLYERREA
jgi:ribosomal protein S18 acetylase RimI-like enzyme